MLVLPLEGTHTEGGVGVKARQTHLLQITQILVLLALLGPSGDEAELSVQTALSDKRVA